LFESACARLKIAHEMPLNADERICRIRVDGLFFYTGGFGNKKVRL
jgi:hypothetical protein